jgi:formylglycine-generating enzyme required for sulfatase activity
LLSSAPGLNQAVEPPGNLAEPPKSAVASPKSAAKPTKPSTERSRTAAGPSRTPAKRLKKITNSIGMQFVLVPAGEFLMGSPASDRDAELDEKPQHRVRITRSFFLGICEVTQQEYQRVMGANPSSEQLSPQQPVETISWLDAVEFCNRLSAKEKLSPYCEASGETVNVLGGNGYRLPTEAEWEYACRAGSTTKWSCGDDPQRLVLYSWYKGNSGSNAHPVGQKAPNAFGLYDMHGHMWEWCWDWYGKDYYQHSPAEDPQGPSSGSLRVERGGDAWNNDPPHLRSAYRDHQYPSRRYRDLGFRVARTSNEAPPAQVVADRGQGDAPAEGGREDSPADRGQEDSPTQTLKKRGIERQRGTPSSWVLKDETAVLGRFRSVQAEQTRLASARAQQRQLAAGGQTSQALIAACQTQIDAIDGQITQIDQQLAALGPSIGNATADNYHNLLTQQHNALVREQRRLSTMINSFSRQGGDVQEQLRQFSEEVEAMEDLHRQAVEELRDAVAEINTRYEELGADDEVTKALSELSATTKLKQRLGPSRELKDATTALARAAGGNRVRTPTKKVRKTN